MDKKYKTQMEADLSEYILLRAHDEQVGRGNKRRKALSNHMVRETINRDELEQALTKVFRNKLTPSKYALQKSKQPKERIVNAIFSDLHFGAMLDPRECPKAYGLEEEARSIAAVCKQIAEYKSDYRKESKLYLHIIGDIIQGMIHDLRSGRPLAEQIAIAIHLLVQAIDFLSHSYPEVEVFCSPGNHGRNPHRHADRAVNQKWDSHETNIYHALQVAFRHYKNVKIRIDYKPFYTWQAFDKKGFATHGDTVMNIGFPSRSINVTKVRQQINEYNTVNEHCDLFIFGHVHTLSLIQIPTGPIVMSNGPLIPPDEFAISQGMFSSACSQWIFESVKGHIVGDARFVTIDDYVRKDKTLEKIIRPFEGF